MAERDNFTAFDDHVSQVFKLLYESFPAPVDIDHRSFTFEDLPEENRQMGTVPTETYLPAMDAVSWLIEEDYIRCQKASADGRFYGVRLTGKGLATLRAVPRSIEGTGSFGKRITDALGSGAGDAARKLVEEAIAWGFRNVVG